MIEIKNRTGAVIFRDENASTIKEAVNAFAKQARDGGGCANLGGADLGGADLGGAYLGRANLGGAYLGAQTSAARTSATQTSAAQTSAAQTSATRTSAARTSAARTSAARTSAARTSATRTSAARTSADADLCDADLGGAYLGGADLGGAYLGGADLGGCDLSTAKNVDAVRGLAHAKNYDPNFRAPPRDEKALAERRAKWKPLTRAERIAKYRERHPEVPIVEDLDAKILEALETGGTLEMGTWHGDEVCGTTHCRGGFAVHLAPGGYEFERTVCGGDTERAARMIYRASTGRAPFFYDTNEGALADIKRCAAEDASEVVVP